MHAPLPLSEQREIGGRSQVHLYGKQAPSDRPVGSLGLVEGFLSTLIDHVWRSEG